MEEALQHRKYLRRMEMTGEEDRGEREKPMRELYERAIRPARPLGKTP